MTSTIMTFDDGPAQGNTEELNQMRYHAFCSMAQDAAFRSEVYGRWGSRVRYGNLRRFRQ